MAWRAAIIAKSQMIDGCLLRALTTSTFFKTVAWGVRGSGGIICGLARGGRLYVYGSASASLLNLATSFFSTAAP